MKKEKSVRKIFHTLLILLIFPGTIFSCSGGPSTDNKSSKFTSISYNEYSYGETSFFYSPLDESFLEEIYGLESHYFTESAGLFPLRPPTVISFKVNPAEGKEVIIRYEDATLTDVSGTIYSSRTREEYYDLWEPKTADSLNSKINWLFDHNIYKKVTIVPGGGQSEGLFIFLMGRPRLGEFLLTVPVVINGREGDLTLPVTLDLDRPEPEDVTAAPEGPAFTPHND